MRIIDAHGNLFGTLNTIDAAVLGIIALLVLGALYLRTAETPSVRAEVLQKGVGIPHTIRLEHPELGKYVAVGDRASDGSQVTAIVQGDLLCKTRMVATVALREVQGKIGAHHAVNFPGVSIQGTVLDVER